NPRVKGYLHLTVAYRSLSRPSSPPGAKASTMRPFLVFLKNYCPRFKELLKKLSDIVHYVKELMSIHSMRIQSNQ
ncbi:hypothetical protein EZS27_040256, partial [termite gut metagenome]